MLGSQSFLSDLLSLSNQVSIFIVLVPLLLFSASNRLTLILTISGGWMKHIKINVSVKFSLAACLFGIAAILDVLFR